MPFRKYHRKNDTNYDNLLDNKFRDGKKNVNVRLVFFFFATFCHFSH